MHRLELIGFLLLVLILPTSAVGCNKDARARPGASTGTFATSQHFDALVAMAWRITYLVDENGQVKGHGLIAINFPSRPAPGQDAVVTIRIWAGAFGPAINGVLPGQRLSFFPNFVNGAQGGRGSDQYAEVLATEVPGSNGLIWEATITNFPTTGEYRLSIALGKDANGNVKWLEGQPFDSSYDGVTESLGLEYDGNLNAVVPIVQP
ncbi:MAG: hypothetical protein HY461_01315 [Parcubacteria group bacterium]|nr:hypothetical protein [Parcubacteria group bacterium]